MAGREGMILRERRAHERMNSSMSSSKSSSYSSNVNQSSSSNTAARYHVDDSKNYVRGQDNSRYYGEDGHQQMRGDEPDIDHELKSIPYDRAPPASSPPPAAQEVPKQPAYTYTPKKSNVRIVGGKLFHVEDDVEGPISIQYIGDHPNPGTRGYHVAKSSYPAPGKPREGFSAGGNRMHFIA